MSLAGGRTTSLSRCTWALLLLFMYSERLIAQTHIPVQLELAEPAAVTSAKPLPVHVERDDAHISIGNCFLTANISLTHGTIESIQNHITRETVQLTGDSLGIDGTTAGAEFHWRADS